MGSGMSGPLISGRSQAITPRTLEAGVAYPQLFYGAVDETMKQVHHRSGRTRLADVLSLEFEPGIRQSQRYGA
jgi:hypothetical protein